ncbi:MAG: hypothetical protein AAFR88_13795, partial [Pseudomonadota bacterium]
DLQCSGDFILLKEGVPAPINLKELDMLNQNGGTLQIGTLREGRGFDFGFDGGRTVLVQQETNRLAKRRTLAGSKLTITLDEVSKSPDEGAFGFILYEATLSADRMSEPATILEFAGC